MGTNVTICPIEDLATILDAYLPLNNSGQITPASLRTAITSIYNTLECVRQHAPLARQFDSIELAITPAALTAAETHSLGAIPNLAACFLKCVNAAGSAGYALNDIVPIGNGVAAVAAGQRGCQIIFTASQMQVRYAASGASGVFQLANKSTGAVADIVNADWKLIVRLWSTVAP